nr:hypothetical protein [uncultured Acetatifactor sp.]
MKNTQELYNYCQINLHTKNWIANIKKGAIMSLQDAIPRCDGSYYAAKQIEFEYPMDLWLILENKCAEKAYLDDVHIVVNMIFQDIADELKEGLLSYLPYSIVFCAKLRGELHCG